MEFEEASKIAVGNILRFGDTDVFPRPFELLAIEDNQKQFLTILKDYNANWSTKLDSDPQSFRNFLVPVTNLGFRWATQIDPLWNALFLTWVIQIARDIERVRVPVEDQQVFSYRYDSTHPKFALFKEKIGWRQFITESVKKSKNYKYVICCDISEFYPRIGHHRVENAVRQLTLPGDDAAKINKFLSKFTQKKSFGLPVGGPAARLISELTINQIDQLMNIKNISYTRFADDYHIFAGSEAECYRYLMQISKMLHENQGLSLQKSKTRILSSEEFQAKYVFEEKADAEVKRMIDPSGSFGTFNFIGIALRFDPYSPNAEEEYDKLKDTIGKLDIVSMLVVEIEKTKIDIGVTKKIIGMIRFLEDREKKAAIDILIDNSVLLFPVWTVVLSVIDRLMGDLSEEYRAKIVSRLVDMYNKEDIGCILDLHLCWLVRILSKDNSYKSLHIICKIFESTKSATVKRDAVLALAAVGGWYYLSEIKNDFITHSPEVRRSIIFASYKLSDEGKHWRQANKSSFLKFESLISEWAEQRKSQDNEAPVF